MIGEQIKKLLKANDMIQVELAQKMNISESKMSKILKGSLEPNITDLKLMSQIFNVSIDEIVSGESKQVKSLIEVAIKEGYESFSNLLSTEPSWIDRKDDKGHDMLYYIKKYNAYDFLTFFYKTKNKQIPSIIQIHYVDMIKTLIEKKLYDKYLEMDALKFTWDFSALNLSLADEEKLYYIKSDSSSVIREAIKKPNGKSFFYSMADKSETGVIELEKYYIFSYEKSKFRDICNQLLMAQNVDPKYLIGLKDKAEYLKTYLYKSKEILNEEVKALIESKNLTYDIDTIIEALLISGDKKKFLELAFIQMKLFKDVDFDAAKSRLSETRYMDIVYGFDLKVKRIKKYLVLAIKYNDLDLFKQLLLIPKLREVIAYATKERTEVCENGLQKISPKFFNFNMPFVFQKEVLETFSDRTDEITIDFEEIIRLENSSLYKDAIEYLPIGDNYNLPFNGEVTIQSRINRRLTKIEYKKLIDSVHSIILEFHPSYLATGKLDYDLIFKNLVNKSLKNPFLNLLLFKIWINIDRSIDISREEIEKLSFENIDKIEKVLSIKEKAIDYLFFEFPTYIDELFKLKNLYSLLPKIKNLNFFKLVISGLNPNILRREIKENNIKFSDIEKVKILYKEYTNKLNFI